MERTQLLQEIRMARFEEIYTGWQEHRLTQEEAARILGVCDRTFRRYINRYEEHGTEGLYDKRIINASHRRAPVDEVINLKDLYKSRYNGFNVKHFHSWYKRLHNGKRSYTWVKNTLQAQGVTTRARKRGAHRKKRLRSPYAGMMIHQDGSTHEWVKNKWWDLIVTMDDASNEHYSMFFVDEEGTMSSFKGIKEVIEKRGVFASLYTDRGSHYWFTPEAGGRVDKIRLTQFGRAMRHLGIQMIPAYSPEARGRSERAFSTHQDRLTKELSLHGISTMEEANRYISEIYLPAFNEEFTVKPLEPEEVFIQWAGMNLDDILCEHYERTVNNDNCVSFEGLTLQIPPTKYRCHYVRVKVRVLRYPDGRLAVFHGPRKLSEYNAKGELLDNNKQVAA